jgi:HAMP domain-containing protein
VLQRILARVYQRAGARVVRLGLAFGTAVGLVTLLITGFWSSRYLQLSARQLWTQIAIAVPLSVGLVLLRLWWSRREFRAVLAWDDGDRSPEFARKVWSQTVALPGALVGRAGWMFAIGGVPLVVLGKLASGISVATAAAEYVAGMIAVLAMLVPVLFGYELVLRPMLADITRFLPEGFTPRVRNRRLRARALAGLPLVTLFGALTVGAFSNVTHDGPVRLLIASGIALATIVIACAIFWLVNRSLLDPVDDLLDATRRVGEGDLATPVQVVTGDELGLLAAGFNAMLADLRRHEHELQESRARIVVAQTTHAGVWSATCTTARSSSSCYSA